MGGKKSIVAIILLVVLLGGCALLYSWQQQNRSATAFSSSGYILVSDQDQFEKEVLFQEGTVWKNSLSDTVAFKDVKGNKVRVSSLSFAHYDDQSVSAFSRGVVVDLNDIETAQVVNHYAVSPQILFTWTGNQYVLSNTDSNLTFQDYIWKLSPDKYLVQSSDISIHFAEGDERPAGNYIEVTYIDKGIIQIQTEENLWQTVSDQCYATLKNGKTVNLSLRNVRDTDGEVLIDFSKIVVNSDKNVEIAPLTPDLTDLQESVIPHFDITAKNGKTGAAGESGTIGLDGTEGVFGEDGDGGDGGSNGGAGNSGSNGAAGSAGGSGSMGAPGNSASVEGTLLTFPTFNIEHWTISATSCSGVIKVKNSEMLDQASSHDSQIYLVDMNNNSKVKTFDQSYIFTENTDGFSFSFSNLEPDHNYRLVVSATINTGLIDAQDYLRDFISKTFWTDSTGIFLEAGNSTVSAVSLSVCRQNYAPSGLASVTVYLYRSLDGAYAATAENPMNSALVNSAAVALTTENEDGSFSGACTFTQDQVKYPLPSNQRFFARVVVEGDGEQIMPPQILTLTTLKCTPTVGAPSLTPNRESWGFDVTPGAICDPDGGIVTYVYEFFAETSISNSDGALSVIRGRNGSEYPCDKSVTVAGTDTFTVPLDGQKLLPQTGYYVRAVAYFNDNEKTVKVVSALSNHGQVNGSQLPVIYYTNADGSSNTGIPTTASELSGWYDQLCGTITIAPGVSSAQVLLDNTRHPVVTIRASGYYYVQYPVYLNTDPNLPSNGKYLTGQKLEGGYIVISLPRDAFSAAYLEGGAVYGLRPDTQYQVIVTGDLSNDGEKAYELNARIGVCVVETPDTVVCQANWQNGEASVDASKTSFSATLCFGAYDTTQSEAFSRQMKTLTSINLTLTSGTSGNPGKDLAVLNLTQDNFKNILKSAADGANTLGQLFSTGFTLTERTFSLTSSSLNSTSAIHIRVSDASDYTALAKHRTNQYAYASTLPNDTSAPGGPSGAVYVNQFSLLHSVFDIQLSAAPDTLPNAEQGFSVLYGIDGDNDGLKNDSYFMTPQYLNSGKLAKTITFYAFDYPDYYGSYPADRWTVSPDYGGPSSLIPLSPVTAVDIDTGEGAWLASVTIDVPSSGIMPSVQFIPQTVEAYYQQNTADAAAAQKAINAYVPGKSTNANGAYLFFYTDTHGSEPANGHQFVFAWTLTYRLKNDSQIRYYPFSLGYTTETALYTPHSAPVDSPREVPTVYALPYASSDTEATWAVYLYDPDNAVIRTDDTAAKLYQRTTAVTAYTIKNSDGDQTIPVHAALPESWSMQTLLGADGENLVTVKHASVSEGSVPVTMGVQWYTDKYSNSGAGIFDVSKPGYTARTLENSTKHQSIAGGGFLIPYYESVFTYYHKNAEYLNTISTDQIKITLDETATDSSSENINRYYATVTGPKSVLAQANGLRLTFTKESTSCSVDKFLEGVDGAILAENGDSLTVNFNLSISRDISDLAGLPGVSVSASLLYETGAEGFSYCLPGNTVSIRSYGASSDNRLGWVLSPNGRYIFNASGALANQPQNGSLLPQFGSFFHVEGSLSESNRKISGTMTVNSTRNNSFRTNSKNVSFDPGKALGAYSGTLSLAPRLVKAQPIPAANLKLRNKDGAPLPNPVSIPPITPIIAYSDTSSNANSITSGYVLSKNVSTIWLLLERAENNHYIIQKHVSLGWIDDTGGATYSNPTSEVLTSPSDSTMFTFYNLQSDTTYRITAFYLDSNNKYQKLNMYDINGTELSNYVLATTYSEPSVKLSVNYYVGDYNYKRLNAMIAVSQVSNYYYTMELQNLDGTPLTYLECGGVYNASNAKLNVLDFGQRAAAPGSTNSGNTAIYRGEVFRATEYNTETHELIPQERMYLNYGGTYRVQIRVYDIGRGPAYGGNKDTDNLVHTANGMDKCIRTFTVNDKADQVNMTGVFQIVGRGDLGFLPTITYTPAYIRNSSTIRQNKCAAVVVRARPTADGYLYDDVTDQVIFGSEDLNVSQACIVFGSVNKLRLSAENESDLFQSGDTFTCYLYGIQDDMTNTTTAGITDTVNRSTILAGRGLGESDLPLSQQCVPMGELGRSILLAAQSVEYISSNTSAGTVSVTMSDEIFAVTLQDPVDQASITHFIWSVSAIYTTDTDGSQNSITVSSGDGDNLYAPVEMTQIGTNTFQILFSPDFSELPSDASVMSYTVSLQFYQSVYDSDGNFSGYSSSGIDMTAGPGAVVNSSGDGIRLTTVLSLDQSDESFSASNAHAPVNPTPEAESQQKLPEQTDPEQKPEETEPEQAQEPEKPSEQKPEQEAEPEPPEQTGETPAPSETDNEGESNPESIDSGPADSDGAAQDKPSEDPETQVSSNDATEKAAD